MFPIGRGIKFASKNVNMSLSLVILFDGEEKEFVFNGVCVCFKKQQIFSSCCAVEVENSSFQWFLVAPQIRVFFSGRVLLEKEFWL